MRYLIFGSYTDRFPTNFKDWHLLSLISFKYILGTYFYLVKKASKTAGYMGFVKTIHHQSMNLGPLSMKGGLLSVN